MDKFPSIPHLTFSPQVNDDDIVCGESDQSVFVGTNVTIHEKMDGGNCCIFKGEVYARTHKHPAKHEWFNTIKMMIKAQPLFYESPYFDEMMIFGENMTAIHSIHYRRLCSYFYIFAVYNIRSKLWCSVDEVASIADKLDMPTAPLLFRGTFKSIVEIRQWMDTQIHRPSQLGSEHREGFVIRYERAIQCDAFPKCYAKYVRKGHIQTDKNWVKTWKKAKLISQPDCADEFEQKQLQPTQLKKHKKKLKRASAASLNTSLIILVGLPGSGKSTFAAHLSRHNPEWHRCGTDLFKAELKRTGAQNTVKRYIDAVCNFIARKSREKEKVIVENCSLTKRKRMELLESAFKPKDAICIHLNMDKQECIRRTQNRSNHETQNLFRSQRGNRIIDSFAQQFEAPTQKEGFAHIFVAHNNDDINALLGKLGVSEPIAIGSDHALRSAHDNDDEETKQDTTVSKTSIDMTLQTVCEKFALAPNQVLNCFVYGSQVYGTATSESDWNLLIVYANDANIHVKNMHKTKDNIAAYMLSTQQWMEQVEKHKFLPWMTLFLPQMAALKHELCIDWKRTFVKDTFVSNVLFEVNKDLKKIDRFHHKKNMDRVRKVFVHSLRMMEISKQMLPLLQDREFHQYLHGAIKLDEIEHLIAKKSSQILLNYNVNHVKDTLSLQAKQMGTRL